MDIAASCCSGKVVLTLEGGYDLTGLRDSVKAVLKELAGLYTQIMPIWRCRPTRRPSTGIETCSSGEQTLLEGLTP
jgi:acetoin utilization deacetylase AcuC-like enzyme